MSNSTWSYAQNVFDNSTKNNFKKMLMVSADHDSKLAAQIADAAINALYIFFHPIYSAYSTAYSDWQSAEAAWSGNTVTVGDLMSQLSADKIEEWDIAIQNVYKQKTGEYKALLPNGRAPFQSGAYELRIAAIQTLVTNIGADVSLAAVKVDAVAFHTSILNARNTQQGKEGLLSQKSDLLELQRVATSDGMYYSLSGLMTKFYQNPIKVEEYFDLELIRNINQSDVVTNADVTVAPDSTADAGVTFEETSSITFHNTGTTKLTIGRSATAGGAIAGTEHELIPGALKTGFASDLGPAGNMFISIVNKDLVKEGNMTVAVT